MTPCDHCERPAVWLAFAAYDVQLMASTSRAHPLLARYPTPLARACSDHLLAVLTADSYAPATTGQWVVVPVPDPEEAP